MPNPQLNMGLMLRRSLIHRRARSFSALIALTVSAAVATALLTLYADLDSKLHHEFRTFGANVVVTASPTGDPEITADNTTVAEALPIDAVKKVRASVSPDAIVAAFGYAVATTDRGTPVVVVGTDFEAVRKLDAWWKVDAWPASGNDALLGQKAANFVADEHTLTLTFSGKKLVLHGTGHLSTGGDEDSRIYIPMATFSNWTGAGATAIEVQVPGGATRVDSAIVLMKQALPGMKVEPVRQLVEGESRIVDRTHSLMYGAVLLIALTVGVSVLATMSASVLERRRDFALMKALGGTQSQMMNMFLLEAMVLALAGVGAGYIIGSAAAFGISELNFHTATFPRAGVIPAVLLMNAIIAAAAALFPARILRTLQPAALLKGE